MEFEWDDNKAELNIRNHDGISFEDAKEVFADSYALDIYDDSHSVVDEKRFHILGLSVKSILLVVYTIRFENIYRIISARKASNSEDKAYWEERNKYE
jgi:uncharacterized protein